MSHTDPETMVALEDHLDQMGSELLNDVMDWLGRFVAYPSHHALAAHALWIAHTHLMDVWDSTPRIAFLSPEPASGKSRALEVTEPLVPNPVEAVNVTPAYLFRKVGEGGPTILYDEIDTVFGPKAKENEEIRGLLNAGHRRGAVAGRCVVVGKTVTTEEIPAYGAVAFAGLGSLPDTILSRCVVIRMRRRKHDETVEQFRRRLHAPDGHKIRTRLARWAEEIGTELPWPDFPDGVADRDADVWEALLMVADAAGDHWPNTARKAATALVAQSKQSTPSLGILLLQHLHDVWGDAEGLWTETILEKLHGLEEAPWGDLRGKPIDARHLAKTLRKYDDSIKPVDVRIEGKTGKKGYQRKQLHDLWQRYLFVSGESATSATSATSGQPHDPTCSGCSASGAGQ
jgi:Protein of unknown function (DUF3631)